MGLGEFNSDDYYIYNYEQELEEMEYPSCQQRVRDAVVGCNLKNDRMISVCF